MATTLIDWRPSALPAALPAVNVHVLGCAAVTLTGIDGIYVPASVLQVGVKTVASTAELNNSIGTSGAALRAEGAASSELMGLGAGILRAERRAADEAKQFSVKGIDARGIPPRGRRKV